MDTNKNLKPVLDIAKHDVIAEFLGPYSEEQVREAFDLVADEKHWKNPIDAFVHPDEVELVSFAIGFMTATKAEVVGTARHSNLVRIKAAGYFNGPAN